ncbi:hypothetical protein BDQ17DRAFT_673751 [Cyathus striatus]|nr:hypothetical protein BDQ17DRAFT_673751 [Cyathus striatus]
MDAATGVQMVRILRCTQLVATLITLYDHACSIDAEVKYIWSSKSWNSSKILFVATRYIGDIFVIFQWYTAFLLKSVSTTKIFRIVPWGTSLLIYLCQVILCYRLSALYNNTKRFIYTLCFIFLLEMLGTVGTLVYEMKLFDAAVSELHENCINVVNKNVSPYWIIIIVFETVLLSLTIRKFCSDFRHAPTLRIVSLGKLIVMDSIMYYCAAFVVYFALGIIWTVKPGLNRQVTASFVPAFSTTIGCRLILHLSDVHDRELNGRGDVWSLDVRNVNSRRGV